MSTWSRVEPLVASAEVRGRRLEVGFRCPESGKVVRSSVDLAPSLGSKVRTVAKRSLNLALRETVIVTIRRLLGWNFLGRYASYFLAELLPQVSTEASLGEGERQAAVLDAFKVVQGQFGWEERGRRYVALAVLQAAQSPFDRLLHERPVLQEFDLDVLARVLAAVARADGEVEAAETALFTESGGLERGTVAALPPPTEGELAETTADVRETILVLAWSMAWGDGAGEAAERELLVRFAAGLGIPPRRAAELADLARVGVIERWLAEAGLDDRLDEAERARVREAARGVGLSDAEYDRIEAGTRRRLGLR